MFHSLNLVFVIVTALIASAYKNAVRVWVLIVIPNQVGQEYTDHVDGYDATTEHGAQNCARGGKLPTSTLASDVCPSIGTALLLLDGRALRVAHCALRTARYTLHATQGTYTAAKANPQKSANEYLTCCHGLSYLALLCRTESTVRRCKGTAS